MSRVQHTKSIRATTHVHIQCIACHVTFVRSILFGGKKWRLVRGQASRRRLRSLYLEDGLHVTRESVPADMFAQAVCHPLVCQYGRVLVRGVSHVLEALSQQRVVLHQSHKVAISRVLCDRTSCERDTDHVRHFPCLPLMLLA